METPKSTDVLLVSADLFLGSRVRGTAESQGRSFATASSGAAAVDRLENGSYRLVLIDLETPGLDIAEVIRRREELAAAAFVAYGPHVKTATLDSARRAGCDEVLTRGQFDATLAGLLSRYFD